MKIKMTHLLLAIGGILISSSYCAAMQNVNIYCTPYNQQVIPQPINNLESLSNELGRMDQKIRATNGNGCINNELKLSQFYDLHKELVSIKQRWNVSNEVDKKLKKKGSTDICAIEKFCAECYARTLIKLTTQNKIISGTIMQKIKKWMLFPIFSKKGACLLAGFIAICCVDHFLKREYIGNFECGRLSSATIELKDAIIQKLIDLLKLL